jgi:hypothetical protein
VYQSASQETDIVDQVLKQYLRNIDDEKSFLTETSEDGISEELHMIETFDLSILTKILN